MSCTYAEAGETQRAAAFADFNLRRSARTSWSAARGAAMGRTARCHVVRRSRDWGSPV